MANVWNSLLCIVNNTMKKMPCHTTAYCSAVLPVAVVVIGLCRSRSTLGLPSGQGLQENRNIITAGAMGLQCGQGIQDNSKIMNAGGEERAGACTALWWTGASGAMFLWSLLTSISWFGKNKYDVSFLPINAWGKLYMELKHCWNIYLKAIFKGNLFLNQLLLD